jgi:RNA polymerase sigma factor (sigma-70 family)
VGEMDGASGQAVVSPRMGPQVTLEEFYETKYRSLMKAVMSVGASEADAQDVIDEVMEEILTKDRWSSLTSPYAWVRKAVLRTYYDKRVRERDGVIRAIEGGHLMSQSDSCLDADLNVWEDIQWTKLMLDNLPPAQREVIQYMLAEFKPWEIAEMLGKTAATVRQNLALARRQLKTQLNDDFEVPDTSTHGAAREGGRR